MTSATDGAWSPVGAFLATVSDDCTVRVFGTAAGSRRTEFRLAGESTGVDSG
ncbi:WD40 repeat domain-containing protein [Amycolatopsis sp. FDAARGOS 1241]|uniref:WD40 repeat domain-containing protein n=1 Tax=Amycolatopsis sp. FDAARGOS 1241 TaxID=2778070 RepID=UPI001951C5C3|nr:WD40 repeat domain-containing protein [Amycolatopsis sp. FDAARGOS 1241]QRP50077.1 hypothetical protein I6J71_21565 [Amycolatopsis sp. FDAARGOS 1241]